jgi:xanthine dehydrogenase YagR molybdenum-binding subunit
MATSWPKKRRLLGTKVPRIDGGDKATGKAKYSYDINLEGLLHAVMIRCPHPRATIKSLDTSAAEKVAGFKALHIVKNVKGECYFAGDEILALCADTEEHAHDAARAVKIEYDVLPAYVREDDVRKLDKDPGTMPPVKGVRRNFQGTQDQTRGDLDEGVKAAEVSVTGTYGMPTISHQCLESHGLVAKWGDDGGLTVWVSTQAVFGTAGILSGHFSARKIDLPVNKVKVITHYMGGGFGSKFGNEVEIPICAELARKAKAPVKLMLDRESEVATAGHRPSAHGTVKIHGKKDGTVTAFESETFGSPGIGRGGTVGPMPYVYPFVAQTKHTATRLNFGTARAMRAPGHPQSCFLTDCALDDFAAKIDMDPMLVRLKILPKDNEEL